MLSQDFHGTDWLKAPGWVQKASDSRLSCPRMKEYTWDSQLRVRSRDHSLKEKVPREWDWDSELRKKPHVLYGPYKTFIAVPICILQTFSHTLYMLSSLDEAQGKKGFQSCSAKWHLSHVNLEVSDPMPCHIFSSRHKLKAAPLKSLCSLGNCVGMHGYCSWRFIILKK